MGQFARAFAAGAIMWLAAAPAFSQVKLADNVDWDNQKSLKIETPSATYYYHKEGAGFSSIFDKDGNDWITHSKGGYRGIPNMVYGSENFFHPGHTGDQGSKTTVVSAGSEKAVFSSVSNNNLWKVTWEIYPYHATMTVDKVNPDKGYWLLYEGTPGGVWSSSTNYYYRPDKSGRISCADKLSADVAGSESYEWVAFGDNSVSRLLYCVHHQNDAVNDYYRPYGMVVWGFGRSGTSTLLKGLPCELTIGFYEGAGADGVKKHIADVMKGGAVAARQNETLRPARIASFKVSALSIAATNSQGNLSEGMRVFDIRGRALSGMKGVVVLQKR